MAPPKTHKRLLGTWQSDRRGTVSEWQFAKRLTPERRRKFLGIFGKLRITYTRKRIRGVFRDYRYTQRYEILGADAESVAIRYEDTLVTNRWRIQPIHFDGLDRCWIALGRNREWFKRVADRVA